MKDKRESIDVPGYKPDERVAFPPKGSESYLEPRSTNVPREAKPPYSETYLPEAPAPDPSQTQPDMPDIRDIDTPAPSDAELAGLSPNIDLKE